MDIKPKDIESDELLDSDDDTVLEEDLIKLIEQAKPLSLELPSKKRDREDDHDMPGIMTDLRPLVKRCLHDILKPQHFKAEWQVKRDIIQERDAARKRSVKTLQWREALKKKEKTEQQDMVWHPTLGFIKKTPSKAVAYYNDLNKPKAKTITRKQFKSLYSI